MSRIAPSDWTWRSGRLEPGRAVIFDMDGVLADAAHRQHYLESGWQDWEGFFHACGDDPLIEETVRLLHLLDPDLQVILLTARPERVHHLTTAWLAHHQLRWDVLVMRQWGDYGSAAWFKESALVDLRQYGFEVELAFEDDRRNVAMFRRHGVPCVYIHSGYYD